MSAVAALDQTYTLATSALRGLFHFSVRNKNVQSLRRSRRQSPKLPTPNAAIGYQTTNCANMYGANEQRPSLRQVEYKPPLWNTSRDVADSANGRPANI
ncbi:hypothetical protein EVAR_38504_1 [Eumeta japonica]|uniref:Uncharacterized protein n=1 Tax=Eumeta variegata TaxID=151549 RepID=A0A4C1WDJ3_EUMVA|nr:hypothetical protein EVAR_38504_1 [Eumeta japonica]